MPVCCIPDYEGEPDRDDCWEKLRHLIEYLRKDNIRPLVLGADNDGLLM